jgi:hypothetical protein
VAAGKIAADVTDPPLVLVTSRLVAVFPATPRVHATVNVVDDTTVVMPQVPLTGVVVTTAPAPKLVPTMVKVLVPLAVPAAGVTLVMVGAAAMNSDVFAVKPATEIEPPSVFVMV